jgi:hypothetical protein
MICLSEVSNNGDGNVAKVHNCVIDAGNKHWLQMRSLPRRNVQVPEVQRKRLPNGEMQSAAIHFLLGMHDVRYERKVLIVFSMRRT